jgi:predicted nucleic acid-binding protein
LTAIPALPFADTNVLLYLISHDAAKARRAERLLSAHVAISVQVLNEFAHVARRKHSLDWSELNETLAGIRHFSELHPLTVDSHLLGMKLAERYRFSLHDAMIAAAALQAGCKTLLSEDFQTGQLIDGRLRVVNPFAH